LLRADLAAAAARQPTIDESRGYVENYIAVLQSASRLLEQGSASDRAEARRTGIQAHLGAARVIATGPWKSKEDTVTQWLERAYAAADEHIRLDRAPPPLLLMVWAQALECQADAEFESAGPPPLVDVLAEHADGWLAANDDEFFQRYARTWYTRGLLAGARSAQGKGEHGRAEMLARRAVDVIAPVAQGQPADPAAELLLGQAYFAVGAIFALPRRDHQAALTWYERAEPLLMAELRPGLVRHCGDVGDRLVSMGLTFWENEQQQRAVEVTECGRRFLEQAVAAGDRTRACCAVACSNLAFMHAALGNTAKAAEMAEVARHLGASDDAAP
jgi:hypothetical protein